MALNPRREHKDSGTKCNGFGVLRAILENACETVGCGLGDLTVIEPKALVSIDIDGPIPNAEDLEPTPIAKGFEPRQPFHFVIFGEKASLQAVILPIARERQADLHLPTGEISNTLLYQIAKDADAHGRPMVMFTLADCDSAGHQMPVSIGRKLQAFRDKLFPALRRRTAAGPGRRMFNCTVRSDKSAS